jgi:hypothetical protein
VKVGLARDLLRKRDTGYDFMDMDKKPSTDLIDYGLIR